MKELTIAILAITLWGCKTKPEPKSRWMFPNQKALTCWAEESAYGGGRFKLFVHKGRRVIVVLRQHTSGVADNELFLYLEYEGKWYEHLHLLSLPYDLEVSKEENWLVIKRIFWKGDDIVKMKKCIEYDLDIVTDLVSVK